MLTSKWSSMVSYRQLCLTAANRYPKIDYEAFQVCDCLAIFQMSSKVSNGTNVKGLAIQQLL